VRNPFWKRSLALFTAVVLFVTMATLPSYAAAPRSMDSKIAVLDVLEGKSAKVTDYYTYGTSMNVIGSLQSDKASSLKSVTFVMKPLLSLDMLGLGGNSKSAAYTVKNKKVTFRLSSSITDAFSLEKLSVGTYVALLKLTFSDGSVEWRSLQDACSETAIDYYTMTKNGTNRHITSSFKTLGNITAWVFTSVTAVLPSDVYDIVIDPGHGGIDSGATSGSKREADRNLAVSKALKTQLEKAGYKVLMTRDGTETGSSMTKRHYYDTNGRVNIVGGSKAKFCFAIHADVHSDSSIHGVQVFRSAKSTSKMAQLLADNIVANTKVTYCNRKGYVRVRKGVYQRTLSKSDIKELKAEAKKYGFAMYPGVTTSTDYYFMIREYGGKVTGAYMDGRNPRYGKNLYYKSNQVPESFLIEMGFITNATDWNQMVNNTSGYAKGITAAVDQRLDQVR